MIKYLEIAKHLDKQTQQVALQPSFIYQHYHHHINNLFPLTRHITRYSAIKRHKFRIWRLKAKRRRRPYLAVFSEAKMWKKSYFSPHYPFFQATTTASIFLFLLWVVGWDFSEAYASLGLLSKIHFISFVDFFFPMICVPTFFYYLNCRGIIDALSIKYIGVILALINQIWKCNRCIKH